MVPEQGRVLPRAVRLTQFGVVTSKSHGTIHPRGDVIGPNVASVYVAQHEVSVTWLTSARYQHSSQSCPATLGPTMGRLGSAGSAGWTTLEPSGSSPNARVRCHMSAHSRARYADLAVGFSSSRQWHVNDASSTPFTLTPALRQGVNNPPLQAHTSGTRRLHWAA